jgi:6-hydroxy-3-succinoylpyridine 3-monooxygenase
LELDLRTNIYVDGFNLYYGALRKTPYRWVNLNTLFQYLLPKTLFNQ